MLIHTMWVQGSLPASYQAWFDSWTVHNPMAEHRLWGEADYLDLVADDGNLDVYESAVNHAQRAEIARLSILYHVGGIVVDADFECLRRFDFEYDCWASYESPGQLTMSILGARPEHPAVGLLVGDVERSVYWQRSMGLPQTYGAGPHLIQRLWADRDDVTRLPHEMFFPYLWTEPVPASFGDAYAVHHWKATWK